MSKVSGDSNQLKNQINLLASKVNESIFNQRKHLLGKVLTVLDATTTDPQQRKATKDLIEEVFYRGSYWNDIRWEFDQLLKAHGFTPSSDTVLETPTEQLDKNIYQEV